MINEISGAGIGVPEFAETVRYRVAAIATEIFQSHFYSRSGLASFVFRGVDQTFNAGDRFAIETGIDNCGYRLLTLYQTLQNRIENGIRGQQILVFLIFLGVPRSVAL